MKKIKLLLALCLTACMGYAQLTTIFNFNSSTGTRPWGSLYSDGTSLYGMNSSGGAYNSGTIFKIMPDGSGYVELLVFNGTNGQSPYGALISDGTFLYGMTYAGGTTSGWGTIFKIMPDGSGFTTLWSFNDNATDGGKPYGDLYYDGTFLYGMTGEGGTNNDGTIFKIKPDGTGYTVLFSFNLTNGGNPYGSLISDGTFLYGMSAQGGPQNQGIMFKIMPDGSGFTDIYEFGSSSGGQPYGSLISDGTFFYGMTALGGANNNGTVFKIKPDGSGFVDLLDFNGTNGKTSHSSLIYSGNFLYGATFMGGANSDGVVFKISPNGSGYTKLVDFNGTNGQYPYFGSLISDGTFLYGMANSGGANGDGTIFKLCAPAVTVNSGAICTGQSFTISPSGAGIYSYSSGNAVVTPTVTTTYSVTGNSSGCLSTNISTVTVNQLPVATITPSGATIFCQGGNVILDAGSANTYSWSNGATTQSITVSASGDYSVRLSDMNGCSGNSSVASVTVNPLPTATITASGATTFCQGNNVTLNASPANTYSWNNGATTQSITASTSGNYSVSLSDINGCSGNSSVTGVTVNPLPVVTITPAGATTFCQGDNVTLNASPANTYSWNNGATTQSITVSTSGNYSVSLSDINGCSGSSSVTAVSVNPLPTATITTSGATTFCQGDNVTLNANSANTYSWNNGATTQSITVSVSGNYSVSLSDINGCSGSSSVTSVTVNPLPAVPTISANSSVLSSSAATGNEWYLNGSLISGATSQSYTALQNGLYTVTVTDVNGCTSTSTSFNYNSTGITAFNTNFLMTVYPNPNNGNFTIQSSISVSGLTEIQLINLLGEQVFDQTIEMTAAGNPITVNTENITNGVYFLILKIGNTNSCQKIVIEK